jgi:hypothetical protein
MTIEMSPVLLVLICAECFLIGAFAAAVWLFRAEREIDADEEEEEEYV